MARPKRKDQVLQFKITLNNTKPPVWHRIQVPGDYTFWDLHVAIQDSMGWLDYHLHEFEVVNPRKLQVEKIGIPDPDYFDRETLPGWKIPAARLFTSSNPKAKYLYDFGDDWEHTVVLEKVLPRDADVEYPWCIAGRRKCPPEDCGGPWGYLDFLQAISDPDHENHEMMMDWTGGLAFDPEDFSPSNVDFWDPRKRLRLGIGFE